jgi:ATP-dependent protease ClpP protease subunit
MKQQINKAHRINNNNISSPSNSYYGYAKPEEFNVSFIPHKAGTYRIEIDGAIEEVSQFSTAIMVLDKATEEDRVEIYLADCPGGNVNAGGALIHSIRKCLAPIHMTVTGACHSLATHILLEAQSFELAENFNSLIHNGSDGAYGNVNEYMAKAKFDEVFRTKQFRDTYKYFLTQDEIDSVLSGVDLWLDAQMWCDRFEHKNKCMQLEQETKEAAAEAEEDDDIIEDIIVVETPATTFKPKQSKPAKGK